MTSSGALPPLVEPGPPLAPGEATRYSRHLLIPGIGAVGQRRLRRARVLVIGAGGLGSPILMYLAAAGIGTLGVVEFDDVELSNLQRQVIHGESGVGRPKGASAREAIRELNPGVEVRWHDVRLAPRNAVNIFRQYDLIIDGTDNFATRYLVSDAAVLAGKCCVWGAIFRFEGQASVFWDAAPGGQGVTYRDLFPEPPAAGTVPSCGEGGVFGVLCGTIGSIMATEAIKLITGTGEPLLGRVLVHDALAMSFRTLRLRRNEAAPRVTALDDYEQLCGVPSPDVPPGAEIAPSELHDLLGADGGPVLIDVRSEGEWALAHLPGAQWIPHTEFLSGEALARIPDGRDLVLYCKTGVRSAAALEVLRAQGLATARHLAGGIDAWAEQIDPTLPRY
ncbi:molybdopterin-synthase adenylyltransferase MoeB [Hoyosella sp. G463]|uniref:Molybdopterin-synthase adenylyltransferase MoeB n=1 Tax=Lolliginicoccus lacisalsi TaxID=2742202 RepID=A0A927PMB4_9ACTN|nr:molybdopterin-synthase adenylyltransferase MoeB [Lolliginicoccus lacisalsi]MBD8506644.1 molybdopterin-synthase adenylyltransferase MoeB [Lolliginicoccus lacisalsi]